MKVRIKDVDLFYESYGHGEPLLLLHGNGQNHEAMRSLIAYFEADYHVIAVDSRGHGNSSFGEKPLSFAEMADDMLVLLDKLGIRQTHVVGYSDGGIIALSMAIKQPERLLSSVVIGANYDADQIRFLSSLLGRIGYLGAKLLAPISSVFDRLKRRLALNVFEPHIEETELKMIRAPFLAIVGQLDVISVKETKKMAAAVQNGEVEVISRGLHFLLKQAPERINKIIASFLKKHTMGV